MRRTAAAAVVGGMMLAVAAPATAAPQAVVTQTAKNAVIAGAAAAKAAGETGLQGQGELTFTFAVPPLQCAPGVALSPLYCTGDVTGLLRFTLRFRDLRPHHQHVYRRVGLEVIFIKAGTTATVTAKLNGAGKAMLDYAVTNSRAIHARVYASVYPFSGPPFAFANKSVTLH